MTKTPPGENGSGWKNGLSGGQTNHRGMNACNPVFIC